MMDVIFIVEFRHSTDTPNHWRFMFAATAPHVAKQALYRMNGKRTTRWWKRSCYEMARCTFGEYGTETYRMSQQLIERENPASGKTEGAGDE